MTDEEFKTAGHEALSEVARANAARLASIIRLYWQRQGYDVKAWEAEDKWSHSLRCRNWIVKSDMVNGLPHDYARSAA